MSSKYFAIFALLLVCCAMLTLAQPLASETDLEGLLGSDSDSDSGIRVKRQWGYGYGYRPWGYRPWGYNPWHHHHHHHYGGYYGGWGK